MPKTSSLTDIQTLRKRARQRIDEGSVTSGYSADREIVLKLLNEYSNKEQGHAEYVAGTSLASMIREDLVAERIAIDSYRDIIQYLGDQDPTTRRMMEGILVVEEEHADELADLLVAFPNERKATPQSTKAE
jgi:bacterioferritin